MNLVLFFCFKFFHNKLYYVNIILLNQFNQKILFYILTKILESNRNYSKSGSKTIYLPQQRQIVSIDNLMQSIFILFQVFQKQITLYTFYKTYNSNIILYY